MEDFRLAGRINRIRQFYFDAAPQVARYPPPPSPDIPAPSYRPSWYQFLTIAGAVAVVNSVLAGGVLGLAIQAGTGELAASAAAGVLAGGGALAAHLIRQREIWLTARQPASSPTGAAGR